MSSKKDYIATAAMFATELERIKNTNFYSEVQKRAAVDTVRSLAHTLAAIHKADNPAFNLERYMTAAGLQ